MTAAIERAGGAREKIDPARLKAIIVGSLGNLVEYYDFYVYAAFSLYFAPSFFRGPTKSRKCWRRRAFSPLAFSCARSAAGCSV
jgi:hypothetical protein